MSRQEVRVAKKKKKKENLPETTLKLQSIQSGFANKVECSKNKPNK